MSFFREDGWQGRDLEVRPCEVLLVFPDDQACVLSIFDFRSSYHKSLNGSPAVFVWSLHCTFHHFHITEENNLHLLH